MNEDPQKEKAAEPPKDTPPPMDDENPEIVIKEKDGDEKEPDTEVAETEEWADDENPEIVVMEKEKEEEPEEVEEKVDDEPIKCPICGSVNEAGATQCFLCQTHISRKEGGKIKVESPKLPGDILTMVDIDDPLTRKSLEELTMIPGVSRVKALYLFQSGINSMEEFIEKAFHGERMSKNFSRTVTNKLLMASIKDGQDAEEVKLTCPSCNAPNPADAANCGVCGFEIDKDMQALNLEDVSSKLSGTVDEVFGDLMESTDFAALPEELKAQMALAMESDDYDDIGEVTAEMELFDLKDVDDVGEAVDEKAETEVVEEPAPEPKPESPEAKPEIKAKEGDEAFAFEDALETKEPEGVPEEPEAVPEEAVPEEPAEEEPPEAKTPPEEVEPDPQPEEQAATPEEPAPEPLPDEGEPEVVETKPEPELKAEEPEVAVAEPEPEVKEKAELSPEELEKKKAEHAKKVTERKEKIKDTLMEKLEHWKKTGYEVDDLEQYLDDLNVFKVQAKKALKKGKVVKEKYAKQLQTWREKGFDVSDLEPLLETDIPAFKEKAKDILKSQK